MKIKRKLWNCATTIQIQQIAFDTHCVWNYIKFKLFATHPYTLLPALEISIICEWYYRDRQGEGEVDVDDVDWSFVLKCNEVTIWKQIV